MENQSSDQAELKKRLELLQRKEIILIQKVARLKSGIQSVQSEITAIKAALTG